MRGVASWRPATLLLLVAAVAAGCAGAVEPIPFEKPPAEVDGASITLTAIVNSCTTLTEHEVVESAESVTITLHGRERGRSCDDQGVATNYTVELTEPLGERVVVDGACQLSQYEGYGACQPS